MQGADYDTHLVEVHEHVWHGFTKFILYSAISITTVLVLMVVFLMN